MPMGSFFHADPAYNMFAKAFGYNVRQARRRLKMTVKKLAYLIGFSLNGMKLIEAGRQVPMLEGAYRISVALRVPLSQLVPKAAPITVKKRKGVRILDDGRVRRLGKSQRAKYREKARKRGFTYPLGGPCALISKIKTRSRVAREKAASVQR